MNVPDSKLNFAFTRINVSLSLGHFKTKIQINLEFSLNIVSGPKRKKYPGKKIFINFHSAFGDFFSRFGSQIVSKIDLIWTQPPPQKKILGILAQLLLEFRFAD